MAISVIPAPAASGGGSSAFAVAMAATNTTYEHTNPFDIGVYTVSVSPTTSNAIATFCDASGVIVTVTTTSGTVSLTLATAATDVYLTLKDGGTVGAIVTIQKTASSLTPLSIGNGTLTTINTTGTYNQTGFLGVLCIGGGEAGYGSGAYDSGWGGAPGGRAGYLNTGIVKTNGATTVTIGAKGTANLTNGGSPVAPTATNFGSLVTTNADSANFPTVSGTSTSRGGSGTAGNATMLFPQWTGNSTTGSGGSGNGIRATRNIRVGGGSGIGTGGSSSFGGNNDYATGYPTTSATAGTGRGAGGGGASGTGSDNRNVAGAFGADGSDGVCYVLRGF